MRISDWSSDVCSSDLLNVVEHAGHRLGLPLAVDDAELREAIDDRHRGVGATVELQEQPLALAVLGHQADADIGAHRIARRGQGDRKSVVSGKSVYVRVAIGGRRISKKKKKTNK